MSTKDALRGALTRADKRWASKHHDDPAPAEYLNALLNALGPVNDAAALEAEVRRLNDVQIPALLRECKADMDKALGEAAARVAQLEREVAEATSAVRSARTLQVKAREALQDKDIQLAEARRDIGDLVTAASGHWHSDQPPGPQIQHAIDLIVAAADQVYAWIAEGHAHQYPKPGGRGRPQPCTCGKAFPDSGTIRRIG